MRLDKKIEFDELDVKCIKEMPIITEVLASTFNKIGRLAERYFNDLEPVIKKDLRGKSGWKINERRSNKKRFRPVTSGDSKINELEDFFQVYSRIFVEKVVKDKLVCEFCINSGYYFDNTENKNWNYFYFIIERWWAIKNFGFINEKSFYEKIKKSIKEFPVEISYENNEESIEIQCEEINVGKINETYQVFKSKILEPFIGSLE